MPGGRKTKITVGNEFGRLTVIGKRPWQYSGGGNILCQCSCGKRCWKNSDQLLRGVMSCGCLAEEVARIPKNVKHGMSRSPVGIRWRGMLNRCYNPKQKTYATYGAVGVIVCRFLRESPKNLEKVIGKFREELPTLDRFPIHNGNYTCGQCEECKVLGWILNVRWATRGTQSRNRGSFNVWLTAFGKTQLLCDWEEESGLDARLIRERMSRGWSVEKSLTTPDPKGRAYRPGGTHDTH